MGVIGLVVKRPNEMAVALKEAQKFNADGKTVLIDVHSDLESRKSKFS